jgi:hypothetical protein
MRSRLALILAVPFAGVLAACEDYITENGAIPPAPTGLHYRLEPSGDPDRPLGIVLRWNAVNDPALAVYNVYSRASTSAEWGLRGSTTSPSFHDDGVPHLEYFVTAANADGDESDGSASVFIDELLRLQQPLALTSLSLDRAIHLSWSDNAFQADPAGFSAYRVYSASYDLDHDLCLSDWTLEGTTVAPTFLAAELVNGAPRCFGVTALSIEGFESLWSDLRYDTPRPDGEEVLVYTAASDPLRSGFRFFLDANGDGQAGPLELGIVSASGSGQMDFVLQADAGGNMQIVPQRANTTFQRYGSQPIRDLTAIDIAPVGGYGSAALLAQPRFGYVFQMNEGDGYYRYGAIRVVATGPDYVIFDWSYQTDRGNPELIRTTE